MNKSRRAFLGTGMAAVAAAQVPRSFGADTRTTFVDIIRPPDFVEAYVEGTGRIALSKSTGGWQAKDVEVSTEVKELGSKKASCHRSP